MRTPWRCSRTPTLWRRDLEDAASTPIFTPAGKLDVGDDQETLWLWVALRRQAGDEAQKRGLKPE